MLLDSELPASMRHATLVPELPEDTEQQVEPTRQ
jgi:hypothetical protein